MCTDCSRCCVRIEEDPGTSGLKMRVSNNVKKHIFYKVAYRKKGTGPGLNNTLRSGPVPCLAPDPPFLKFFCLKGKFGGNKKKTNDNN